MLLFSRKLVAELGDMGFEINPYDPCVANKTVNGTQMTVRWHVDDLMISHTNQADIMAFMKKIKYIYGENLAEKVGTVNNYLGMAFNNSFDNKVWMNMNQYIKGNKRIFTRDFGNVCNTSY